MLVKRHAGLEHDNVKWLMLITFAGVLVLAAARPTSGDASQPVSPTAVSQ